jgi:hypothetical protein
LVAASAPAVLLLLLLAKPLLQSHLLLAAAHMQSHQVVPCLALFLQLAAHQQSAHGKHP